ncbi:MAG TPA: transketolase family protein [Candidatus Gastranaerophilaceae bacterium]|nr:transketolase family protein [Candidatus Gastranaerophilaceae bacterium]
MNIDREKTKSIRSAYGKALAQAGKENENIVVLDADLSSSTQTSIFAKEFPQRFFNMGIAEQDMITTAAGLASQGKIPFASTFAMFATGRTYDQIRNSICYPKFNVKIVATHGGITVGEDGASHQALEDVALMRGLPNMTVIIPADCRECEEVIKFAAKYKGPMYIRIARTNVPDIFDENYKFDLHKAKVLKEGSDVTIVTNGETLAEVIECAQILENSKISAQIIHAPVVKPLDNDTILEGAVKTGFVVTVENHSVIGGLGSAVCELLSEKMPTRVLRIGINDEFGQSGEQRELMEFYGLTAQKLAEKIRKVKCEKS